MPLPARHRVPLARMVHVQSIDGCLLGDSRVLGRLYLVLQDCPHQEGELAILPTERPPQEQKCPV